MYVMKGIHFFNSFNIVHYFPKISELMQIDGKHSAVRYQHPYALMDLYISLLILECFV